MEPVIHSKRLFLRHFVLDDAKELFHLNNDPEVLKHTGDLPFTSEREALHFIQHYDAYQKTGIGRYAVVRKEDKKFLGWCGLKYHPEIRQVDIGFRFYRHHWNKGYATESAKAVIDYAFKTLRYPFLIAHVHIDNAASHKVIKKCGLHKISSINYDGMPALLYQLQNAEYQLREITSEETWPVRHPVLRKGRPLEDVYMEADEKESTFHLGIFYQNSIVGVASFMQDTHPDFPGVHSRLRGMAVLPEYRKKGLAELLLKKGEQLLKEKGRTLLWFNARIVALNFYKTLGYKTVGPEFNIPKIGAHFVMKKELI